MVNPDQETTMAEDLLKRITINPKVMVGKPVVRGTRITVELIMRELANGWTIADFLDAYPHSSKRTFGPPAPMRLQVSRTTRF